MVEEKWSLERFCLSPEFKNFYSQFLWSFPIERFDFIGITEYYETEMAYFSDQILGAKLQIVEKNKNPSKDSTNSSYFEDSGLRERIEQYHSKDIFLYKQAINMRLKRC